jgi:hypothetical protein
MLLDPRREPRVVAHELLERLILVIAAPGHLHVARAEPHRVLDHLLVRAGAHRHGEHDEHHGEHGGGDREAGAARVAPHVAPGQTEDEPHLSACASGFVW